jgi:hypothetical protein
MVWPSMPELDSPESVRTSTLRLVVGALPCLVLLAAAGCGAGNEVGHFTVLSTKLYDRNQTYTLLGRFRGSSHPPFGGANVEDAVEDALTHAHGGIYLTNVVVKYGGFPSGFDVEGDVYGPAPATGDR